MPSKKVFVVHGRDLLAREAVAQVLRDLRLDPVVLGREDLLPHHHQKDRNRLGSALIFRDIPNA